jgi:hypothetical protein
MRNDIVHHRGIATAGNSGRCEVLRWFKADDPMHVMPVHVVEFMSYRAWSVRRARLRAGLRHFALTRRLRVRSASVKRR